MKLLANMEPFYREKNWEGFKDYKEGNFWLRGIKCFTIKHTVQLRVNSILLCPIPGEQNVFKPFEQELPHRSALFNVKLIVL